MCLPHTYIFLKVINSFLAKFSCPLSFTADVGGERWNSYLLKNVTGGCRVLLGCDSDAKPESGPAVLIFFSLIKRLNFFVFFFHNTNVEQ